MTSGTGLTGGGGSDNIASSAVSTTGGSTSVLGQTEGTNTTSTSDGLASDISASLGTVGQTSIGVSLGGNGIKTSSSGSVLSPSNHTATIAFSSLCALASRSTGITTAVSGIPGIPGIVSTLKGKGESVSITQWRRGRGGSSGSWGGSVNHSGGEHQTKNDLLIHFSLRGKSNN